MDKEYCLCVKEPHHLGTATVVTVFYRRFNQKPPEQEVIRSLGDMLGSLSGTFTLEDWEVVQQAMKDPRNAGVAFVEVPGSESVV